MSNKIVICMIPKDETSVMDVAVVLMQDKYATHVKLFGENYDEEDGGLASRIIEEETDINHVNCDDVQIEIHNVSGNDTFIEFISDAVREFSDILNYFGHDLSYIIYNDMINKNSQIQVGDFTEKLLDYIEEMDADLIPTPFSTIFTGDNFIEDLLVKYNIKEHSFTESSTLSGAIWTSIVFDHSFGNN